MANKDFTLTHPEEFLTMPWRNGLGTTIELLKYVPAGDERFSYRLSIATVSEDGPFSSFDGYDRTLVLLKGAGITLRYVGEPGGGDSGGFDSSDVLERPLEMASFDGGVATHATLHDGPITDFNIMTRSDLYRAQITCGVDATSVVLGPVAVCLAVYAIDDGLQVCFEDDDAIQMPSGSLLHNARPLQGEVTLQGASFIAVELFHT